jgi:GNAT superfamily N-acetyltransferase
MWPLLRPGDVARVVPLERSPRAGDIVVYVDQAARLVAHRIIDRLPDGRFRVRGDFAFTGEPPVEARRILGRLTSVDRAGARAVDLDGTLARVMALAVPWLERAAPGLLQGARHTVIRTVQLAGGLWSASPMRRLRRLGPMAGRVSVCRASAGQARELADFARRVGRDPLVYERLQLPDLAVFARRPTGAVVGVIRLSCEPASSWRIADCYVEHRWRGLGIGRAMAAAAIDEIRDRGGIRIWVEVPARARAAICLCRSLGFRGEAPGRQPGRLVLDLPLPSTQPAHIVAAR